jgi:hypothetical protein
MITEDDTPVIIDFDSSSPPGTLLDHTKRTHGWFDPAVRVSQESNDLRALGELRVWLAGSSPKHSNSKSDPSSMDHDGNEDRVLRSFSITLGSDTPR